MVILAPNESADSCEMHGLDGVSIESNEGKRKGVLVLLEDRVFFRGRGTFLLLLCLFLSSQVA